LSLFSSASAFGVNVRSSANTVAWNLVLPQNGGTSGQVLQTDGTGATVWSTLVNAGVAGELAWYNASGSSVDGNVNATISGGALTLGVLATTAGSLKLNGGTSGVVTINTAAAAGTWSLTLPVDAGTSGQVLTTDGAGVTSWTTAGGSAFTRTEITATAGQTSFAATYTVGRVQVFLNGVLLANSDYTATNGTAVVLGAPAVAGDIVDIIAYNSVSYPLTGVTVGSTTISSGTNGRILFENSGVLGEKAVTGTGDVVLKEGPEIKSLRETKTNGAISGGTLTIDCALGNVLAVPLNANITTVTFTNVPATGSSYSTILSFTADGTARTITWPAAVRWPNGTAPTMTSTNGKVDTIVLYTYDGGTNWFGFVSGQNA
jgi:hypothetical protein